jgi:hypothetical protein
MWTHPVALSQKSTVQTFESLQSAFVEHVACACAVA